MYKKITAEFEIVTPMFIGDGDDTGSLRFDYPVIQVKQRGSWLDLTPAQRVDKLYNRQTRQLQRSGRY